MTILGSAKQDRKIKTHPLVILTGKKDTVLYHGELLDSCWIRNPWRWQVMDSQVHSSSLPPRIVTVTKIFLLFLFHVDTSRL